MGTSSRIKPSRSYFIWALFSVVLLSEPVLYGVNAVPIPLGTTCRDGCPNSNKGGKLNYQAGQKYTYDIESAVSVSLAGSDAQETTLHIQGQAELIGISADCQYGLRLQNVIVTGPDTTKTKLADDGQLSAQLGKTIRFTLSNDELHPEICADPTETAFSLNLKRAVVSLLQSADAKTQETDVFGTCPTSFSIAKNGDGSQVVSKTRNLNACGYRETLANSFISGVFNERSDIKSTPLLNGDYAIEQRINKQGVIESVKLTEDYVFTPFSTVSSGARARVVTKLALNNQAAGAAPKLNSVTKPRSILFENPDIVPLQNYDKIAAGIKNTIETYTNNVGPKAASQFTELIRLLRHSKKDDILKAYHDTKSKIIHSNHVLARKIFLDALFRAGTANTVEALSSLLSKEITNQQELRLAYLSFNLASSVSSETLATAAQLIDLNPPREGYLSIGNLVSKYCENNDWKPNEIKPVLEKLANRLGKFKGGKRKQEDLNIAVLKGIRNTNNIIRPTVNKLIEWSGEKQVTRVRVAAIQAFKAGACLKEVQTAVLKLLKNTEEDSEIRIEAYLVLTHCANADVAKEIQNLLDNEPSVQVGSYITSHLASLRASTDVSRQRARSHLISVRSSKKFPSDFRQFSFNREISYSVDSLGIGASIDADVIYSPRSFLPRSLRSNITGALFGNDFNILELQGRQENLDALLEHVLGPKGTIRTSSNQELVNSILNAYKGDSKRSRRGLREDTQALGKQVTLDNEVNQDIDLDLSIKLFGSELYFLSLADNLPLEGKDFVRGIKQWLEQGAKKLKDGESYLHESHSLFLDSSLVYPTGVGLPLKFVAQGAGVIRLEAKGNVDVKEFAKNPVFKLKLVPSYNIEVTGTLGVDAYAVNVGLQVSGSVHSSTGAELSFGLVDKKVDINLNLPLKKQELFSFAHKILFVTQERGKESVSTNLKFSSKKNDIVNDYCFDQPKKVIGIVACVEASLAGRNNSAVALFPLNGPSRGSISLEVEKNYNLQVSYDDKKDNYRSLTVVFDTPGSQIVRKSTVVWEASKEDKKAYTAIKVDSPIRQASAELGYLNDNAELSVYAKANDLEDEYLAKVGFKKAGSAQRQEYEPIVNFKTPGHVNDNAFGYKVNGKIIVDKTKAPKIRYEFNNVQVVGSGDKKIEPIGLSGFIEREELAKFSVDLTLSRKPQSGTLQGKWACNDWNDLDLDLSLTTNQVHDLANGKVKIEYKRSETELKNNLVVVYGKDLESKTNRIELINNWTKEKVDDKLVKLDFNNIINVPIVGAKANLNGAFNDKLVKYDAGVEYGKHRLLNQLTWKHDEKSLGDWDISLIGKANVHSVDLKSVKTIDSGSKKATIKTKLTSSAGTNVDVESVCSEKLSWNEAEVSVKGTAVFVAKQEPYKFNANTEITPKLGKSEGKLDIGSVEWVSYKVHVDRPADVNAPCKAEVDVKVKDVLSTSGQFNSVKRAGTASIKISLPKLPRELKLESKFNVAAPRFDIRTELYYDADQAKKIVVDTKNKYSKSSIDSDNSVEIGSDKYVLTVDGSRTGESINSGQVKGKVLLRLPSNRELVAELDRNINIKVTPIKGTIKLKATDTVQVGGKKSRSVTLDGTLTDGDLKERLFNLVYALRFVDFDGKDVNIESTFTHLPKGHYKSGSAGVTVKGALVPNTFDVLLSVEEYCPIHAVYKVTAKYGGSFNFNVKGNYHVGERGVKPTTYELNAEAAIPQSSLKSVKLETSGSLQRPAVADADGQYDLKLNIAGALNDKKVSLTTSGKASLSKGSLNANLNVPDVSPVNVELSYGRNVDEKAETKHADGVVAVTYGNGKLLKFSGSVDLEKSKKLVVKGSLQTPYEKAKSSQIAFESQIENNVLSSKASLKVDEKECSFDGVLVTSNISPSINVEVKCTPDHHAQLNLALNRVTQNRHKIILKLTGLKDLNIDASADANHENIENFALIIDVDAPKVNLNKARLDIQAKPNAGGSGIRGFEIKASNGGKNILSGYADYQVKEDKGKTVVSGQGSVKWYDEQQKASFNLVRNNFEEARDNETGTLFVFNGNLGNKKTVAELKVTNKVFLASHTVCEGNKQCTNLKAQSVLEAADVNSFSHTLLVTIDLREWGYEHEFNLKSETKRNGWTLEHDLDMHLQSLDKSKYQYNVYIKPSRSGIELAIPSRTIAVEAIYKIPEGVLGKYDASVSAYLDKVNQPNKISKVGFSGEIKRGDSDNSLKSSCTLKFSHPNVKELKVVGTAELNADAQALKSELLFDVFKTTNQALLVAVNYGNSDKSQRGFNLTSELKVESQGLGIKYVFAGHAGASLDRRQLSVSGELSAPTKDSRLSSYVSVTDELVEIILTAFNEELVHLTAKLDFDKQKASVDAKARILGVEPVVGEVEVVGASVKGSIKRGNLVQISGEITAGKEASLRVLGSGKEILSTKLSLSSKDFLAPEYKINDADFKEFVENIKTEVKKDTDQARELVTTKLNKVKENLSTQIKNVKENIPDLSNLANDYKQGLGKLRDELLAVKSIKEVVDIVQNAYATISELSQVLVEHIQKLNQLLTEFFQQLWDGVNANILPALKESLKKLGQIGASVYDELVSFTINLLDKAVKQLKAFENDFAKIGKSVSDSIKSIGDFINKYTAVVRTEVTELVKLIVDAIKGIPAVDVLREKLNETFGGLIVPENIVAFIREISENLRDLLPTPELQDLLQKLVTYIEDKIQNKKVNEVDSLKAIYVSFLKAARSVGDLLRPYISEHSENKLGSWWAPVPLSFDIVRHLPHVPTVKFSVWNYIRNEELPSVKDAVRTYRPHGFNPLNWIPPLPKVARVIDGIHLITFDGRHITLPGACQYVLAQDVVNGNLSIVATIADGALTSIGLVDKSGDAIEIGSDAQAKLNGAATEYPIHQNDLHAWRDIYSVSIITTYGARVHCKADLKVCHIYVNGYYHNKLRGLLGNANLEPNDDLQLPSGKVGKLADLAEAYKLQKSCPAVSVVDKHEHGKDDAESEECRKAFDWNSSLRGCYYFIDPQPYRDACAHSVASASNKEQAVCNIAFGYASVCRSENIPVSIPSNCQKCHVVDASGKEIEQSVGDIYTVVNPQKKADIVLVVDTAIGDQLSSLVDATITELRKELKSREITDVRVNVIGFNKEKKFLSRFTSKGQLDITGKFVVPQSKSSSVLDNDKPLSVGCESVDKALETAHKVAKRLEEDLGLSADGRAFRTALQHPFRSSASKVIIAIRSDPLTHSINPLKILGATVANSVAIGGGIAVHAFTPTANLTFDNEKDTKQVVGFNSNHVLQLNDAKKRSNFGSTELRTHLNYGRDLGISIIQHAKTGYVFSLTNYNALADKDKKQFVSVAANALADQIARTEITNECVCYLHKGLFAQELCVAKDRKTLPPVKKAARRG